MVKQVLSRLGRDKENVFRRRKTTNLYCGDFLFTAKICNGKMTQKSWLRKDFFLQLIGGSLCLHN